MGGQCCRMTATGFAFFIFRKELVMNNMQLFENQPVRMAWDEEREEWYFSIVDVVKVLTEQQSTRGASDYWHVLKNRLKKEGVNELLTNCKQFRP